MPLETSRSISHVVQRQSFNINMEVKVTHNPGNKILKKADIEKEYEGSVKLDIAGKGFTVSGMMEAEENFTDMCNRLAKLAIYKLSDSLFPSQRAHPMVSKSTKKK